jgi:RNA polymerase sigma-70 factor (ECF subfamily)
MSEQKWTELDEVLRAFIRSKVKDPNLTEDLLQESLIKIHLNLHRLKSQEKLMNWAFQISRNVIIDHHKRTKRIHHVGELALPDEAACHESTFTQDLATWIPEAIKLLPEKYRQAIYLTEIEGLTQKELAEKLGISVSGAKSRVQRGREKLKDIVLQCCEVVTDKYGNVLDYYSRQEKKKQEECCDKG